MIVTKTPFRMSFFGGGTDFSSFYRTHGGTVLSTTFDKYCYVTLRHLPPFFDYTSEFVYSRTERVRDNKEILHPAIREAMMWHNVRHVRLAYEADLPARSGLGTSSAFAVGMLHAIHAARGEQVDARTLASEAIYLERTLCRESGGVQDQIAAAFGGFNRIDLAGEDFTVTPVQITPERKSALAGRLLLFFTGISRYAMDLEAAHEQAISDSIAAHIRMRDMAREATALLEGTAPLDDFGAMLHEGWCLKRGITDRITNDRIDAYYQRATDAGALGGKLLGAGGGGFLLFYVPEEKQEAVRGALADLVEIAFAFESGGSQVIFQKDSFLKHN